MRTVYTPMLIPTRDLGRVLIELDMGGGERLVGEGVSGEEGTVSNVGMRRLAGI